MLKINQPRMVFSNVIKATDGQLVGPNLPRSGNLRSPNPHGSCLADLKPVATSIHLCASEFLDNLPRRSPSLRALSEPFVSAGLARHSNEVRTLGEERVP